MAEIRDFEVIEVLNSAIVCAGNEYHKNKNFKKQTDLIVKAIEDITQKIILENGHYKANALILACFNAIKTCLSELLELIEEGTHEITRS